MTWIFDPVSQRPWQDSIYYNSVPLCSKNFAGIIMILMAWFLANTKIKSMPMILNILMRFHLHSNNSIAISNFSRNSQIFRWLYENSRKIPKWHEIPDLWIKVMNIQGQRYLKYAILTIQRCTFLYISIFKGDFRNEKTKTRKSYSEICTFLLPYSL